MRIFDSIFGRNDRTRKEDASAKYGEFDYGTSEKNAHNSVPMEVFHPTSFDDVEKIIDALREGKNAVVHLENVKPATAVRVLDMLSGAIFALNGGLYEIQKNTYMFSPSGLTVR